MKRFMLSIAASMIFASSTCLADNPELDRLVTIVDDYAKCMDVVHSDGDEYIKMKMTFMEAIFLDVEKMVDIALKDKHPTTLIMLEVYKDKKVIVGYVVAKASATDEHFKAMKEDFLKKNNFDWRENNRQIWSANGCNAIYNSLQ